MVCLSACVSECALIERRGGVVRRREGGREGGGEGRGRGVSMLYLVSHLLWCTAQASLPGG